jgi:phage shock protein PspC (stress-responsive transcriptional regulator)
MPVPVIIGIALIALGFGLAVYIVIATIRDRQQVRPLNIDEDE